MIFLSRGKSPSYLMIPGFEEIVQTVHGNLPVIKKPKWLKFLAFGPGAQIHAPGLNTRHDQDGKAGGFLDTEVAARKLDLPEQEIIDFLKTHPSYGTEFTIAQRDESELGSNEEFIVPDGETGFFCKLCEVSVSTAQGLTGHKMSKKHQIHEEAFYEALRERLQKHTHTQEKEKK
jgi:hypothetical protein